MKEADLTRLIIKALREHGGWWVKIHGSAYMAGIPDILGCYEGRFVAIEVKRPDTSYGVTPRQQLNLDRIAAAGGLSGVATSVAEALLLLGV